jgi:enoyl-CoA hydratase/carnithine racemase
VYDQPLIDVRADGAVRVVTLDDAERLNAFSEALHEQFVDLWADVERDAAQEDGCRAVVLTGAGRAFSAGGSYEDFEGRRVDLDRRRRSLELARELAMAMIDVRVPVVAAVNGPAVGLGCTVVTLCDIVFIAEGAFLADPHVSVALVAGDGGATTWPAHTSLLRAKQYLLTGDRIPAPVAVELGLANVAVPADRLLDEATAFAQRLAAQPPQAVQETKRLLNQHLRANAERTLALGLEMEGRSHDTPEYRAAAERLRGPAGA